MSDLDRHIARYRARAEECRVIAERIGDARPRAQYMDAAGSYLKFAEIEIGRAASLRKPWGPASAPCGHRMRCSLNFPGNVCRVTVL